MGGVQGALATGIALIGEGDFDVHTRGFLHFQAQVNALCPILLIGRCGEHCKQVPQGIDRKVHLLALAFLSPVKSSAVATFRGALQRPTVHDDRAWFSVPGLFHSGQQPQIMGRILKTFGLKPAVRQQAHRRRGRNIVGQAPVRALQNNGFKTSRMAYFRYLASFGLSRRYGSRTREVSASASLGSARHVARPFCSMPTLVPEIQTSSWQPLLIRWEWHARNFLGMVQLAGLVIPVRRTQLKSGLPR